jgi:TPR repeat protein
VVRALTTEHRYPDMLTLRISLAAWAILALICGRAIAGPFDEGSAAQGRGDYTEAAKWYRKAAEQGDARAQANLGVLYQFGWGVPQDAHSDDGDQPFRRIATTCSD